ncbi:MAG: ornithine carbamoyltransferase [Thermodesulfovibrionales bacterium]|nr:ornithine carbamoyltransferase [Thermodesulfovibrionales bacterium]
MKRDFLTVWDLSESEIEHLIKRAIQLKSGVDRNKCPLLGKSIGMIFHKPSTRTRVSFEVGIYQLGAQPIYLNSVDLQLGRGESISDTAKVLSRYLSAMVIRTYNHSTIEEFAKYFSGVVINGLSDEHHPCQAIADMMTIYEYKGVLKGVKLAYVGDGNNVANSLIEASAKTGVNITIACPEGFEPNKDVLNRAKQYISKKEIFTEIKILHDPEEAVSEADVIYTDVWVSMGQEQESRIRRSKFKNFQINERLLRLAKKDTLVMHCLPAHRGEEITDEVMDGNNSIVFDQAENRLHSSKAILELLLSV